MGTGTGASWAPAAVAACGGPGSAGCGEGPPSSGGCWAPGTPHLKTRNAWMASLRRLWCIAVKYSKSWVRPKSPSFSLKKEFSISGYHVFTAAFCRRFSSIARQFVIVSSSAPIRRNSSSISSPDLKKWNFSLVLCFTSRKKKLRNRWKELGISTRYAAFNRLRHWPSIMEAKEIMGFGFRKCIRSTPPPKSLMAMKPLAPGLFKSKAVQTVYSI
mmetsp:Transcript_46035/g.147029  ORF Transcript_46035/g.147029 Transcript_46035/m.147029 type:complete len:215 (-) Transcript_46035:379-1023(-)